MSDPVVVMGIVVEGAENASRVRKVMVISLLFAALIIANSVLQQVEDNSEPMERVMSVLLPLLVPACGYLGAKRADRTCLGCFWGCNAFSAVCNAMTVAMWILMITLYSEDVTRAHEACYGDYCQVGVSYGNTNTCVEHEMCRSLEGIVVNQTRCAYQMPRQPLAVVIQHEAPLVGGRTCPEIKRSYEMLTKEKWDLRLMVVLGLFTVILNTCACWHGKRLYDENVFSNHGYPSRPMHNGMMPIHVQVRTATARAARQQLHQGLQRACICVRVASVCVQKITRAFLVVNNASSLCLDSLRRCKRWRCRSNSRGHQISLRPRRQPCLCQ